MDANQPKPKPIHTDKCPFCQAFVPVEELERHYWLHRLEVLEMEKEYWKMLYKREYEAKQ